MGVARNGSGSGKAKLESLTVRLERLRKIVEAESAENARLKRAREEAQECEFMVAVTVVIIDIFRFLCERIRGNVCMLDEYGFRSNLLGEAVDRGQWGRFRGEIRRQTGLSIRLGAKEPRSFIVRTRGYSKSNLNPQFAELFAEGESQKEAWQKLLPELARRCVKRCVEYLETIPHKYVGIAHKTLIDYPEKIDYIFGGKFKFNGRYITYDSLRDAECQELIAEMNKLVAGGSISLASEVSFWLQIEQMPDKPPVPQELCVFDYMEFCNRYNQVTEELREVFGWVILRLQPLVPYDEQVERLRPNRIAQCRLDEAGYLDFTTMKELFQRGVHKEALRKAVQDAAGFTLTKMTLVRDGGVLGIGRNDRIEFEYDLPKPANELPGICADQLQTEKKIRQIKRDKYRYIARQLVELVVTEDGKRRRGKKSALLPINVPRMLQPSKLWVALNSQYEGDLVDLGAALGDDEKFAWKVADEVRRFTRGLITIEVDPQGIIYATIGSQAFVVTY